VAWSGGEPASDDIHRSESEVFAGGEREHPSSRFAGAWRKYLSTSVSAPVWNFLLAVKLLITLMKLCTRCKERFGKNANADKYIDRCNELQAMQQFTCNIGAEGRRRSKK